MLKFKDIFPDYQAFRDSVKVPVDQVMEKEPEWLKETGTVYNFKLIHFILSNAYNERYIRFEKSEFLGYFLNDFLTYTPTFYGRLSSIIADKISELQDKEKAGVKTILKSNTERGESTEPYVNVGGSPMDDLDSRNYTNYDLSTTSPNLIEIAKNLAGLKINGEVSKYVASFDELFSQVDLSAQVEQSFTPKLAEILSGLVITLNPALDKVEDIVNLLKINVMTNNGVFNITELTEQLAAIDVVDEYVDQLENKIREVNIALDLIKEDVRTLTAGVNERVTKNLANVDVAAFNALVKTQLDLLGVSLRPNVVKYLNNEDTTSEILLGGVISNIKLSNSLTLTHTAAGTRGVSIDSENFEISLPSDTRGNITVGTKATTLEKIIDKANEAPAAGGGGLNWVKVVNPRRLTHTKDGGKMLKIMHSSGTEGLIGAFSTATDYVYFSAHTYLDPSLTLHVYNYKYVGPSNQLQMREDLFTGGSWTEGVYINQSITSIEVLE